MENENYLRQILNEQNLSQNQLDHLRNLRNKIETQLKNNLKGNPRFYYAGSFGKNTLIKASYDLDIIIYWSSDSPYTLEEIYKGVGEVLNEHWKYIKEKRVGWELPFEGDFHIDIVPGKSSSSNDKYAFLFNRKTNQSFKTSIKIHIDLVRNSGRRDAIRLMKLWKKRKNVPITSFVLEQMVIKGCKDKRIILSKLEPQLMTSFHYLNNNILSKRILDPANSNNIITNDLTKEEKHRIKNLAKYAIEVKTWKEVFQ